MPSKKSQVFILRIATGMTIFMGAFAMIGGLLTAQTVHAFKIPIPAWVLGAVVLFTGVRYWLRLKDLQRKAEAHVG